MVIWTDFSVIFLTSRHLSCLSCHPVMSSAQVLSPVYFLTVCFIETHPTSSLSHYGHSHYFVCGNSLSSGSDRNKNASIINIDL